MYLIDIINTDGEPDIIKNLMIMNNAQTIQQAAREVYENKGLNGVYSFLKKSGYDFDLRSIEFGLNTNKSAVIEKIKFLNNDPGENLHFHYYSRLVKSRKNGYGYNVIRGIIIYNITKI